MDSVKPVTLKPSPVFEDWEAIHRGDTTLDGPAATGEATRVKQMPEYPNPADVAMNKLANNRP